MKPGQNPKQRSRGRSNNNGGGGGGGGNGGGNGGKRHMPPRNQTFDSNGPEIRIRGNAHQVLEKYLSLARDASAQGDRIAAENFYQHAEHYFRVINAQNGGRQQQRPMSTPADDHLLLAGDLESDEGEQNGEAQGEGTEQEASENQDNDAQDGDSAEADAEDENEPAAEEAEVIRPEPAAVVNG